MHNLAIKSDGTLWAWGQNNNGQVGNNSNTDQPTPVQIGTDNDWWKISAGTYYSTAIKNDGTLWAWGSNSLGQTGTLTTNYPHMIGTDTDWVHVATGLAFTSAIKSDGTLWMWGYNDYGQLGNGTDVNSNVPAQVGTDNDWVFTSHGSQHILALKSDGTLWSWGSDSAGSLGLGSLGEQWYPTQIGTDNNWIQVCAGYSSGAAIKSNGTLWTWGYNDYGMVGDGTFVSKQAPVQIGTDTDWQNVTITTHTMAIKTNGTLWAWGRNNYGKIGNGVVSFGQSTPVQIGTDTDWIKVLPGFEHSLGLKGNGTLWAWGHNNFGQLGDNTTVDKIVPTQTGSICNEPLCTITVSPLAPVTAQCSVALSDVTVPTVVDNCENTITAALVSGTFPITAQGTTPISWKFQNTVNTVIVTQNIIIDDTTAPVPTIATLPDITTECQLTAGSVTAPTALDACAGTITGTTTATFPITTQSTTTITWTYNDGNGNTSTQTQNVIIDDTTAPVPTIATLPNVTAQCQLTAGSVTAPTALDACAGTITGTTTATFPITTQGTTTITWTYNDGNGNTSTQTQNVIIDDTTAPVIDDTTAPVPTIATLPNVTAQCQFTAGSVTAPTAFDACAGTITGTTTATFPITTQGTTTITWTYNDSNGNTSTQTQNVVIDDTTVPQAFAQHITVDLDGNPSVTITADEIDNGSTDNCSDFTLALSQDTFTQAGSYTITLTITDIAGNTAQATATVTVIDSSMGSEIFIRPELTLYPQPAAEKLFISTTGDITVKTVRLYDLNGKTVYAVTENARTINLPALSDGTYIVIISTDKGIYEKQLVLKK
ncbi:T9SS type A sorting domain-containing protein [Flavobacterium akiainvivens]|uniref:RCC1 domain-containing protein n=2 Tax=Flavobacterium akiainvivens TaxID=1202724 RepID=UPI000944A385|nr:T9SS type A sorting domain-containing protein [Flavobacterium akiainvivens]